MASVRLTEAAFADLERIGAFWAEQDRAAAEEVVLAIQEAVLLLARHPFIGRRLESGKRELVVSRGARGHVALYRHDQSKDAALVLRISHQREAGYPA